MTLTFIELANFTRAVSSYFESDGAYADFQKALLEGADAGSVMRGCGGLRKVRWQDPRRGKGKRGGLRVIYLHVPEISAILLLDVYDKDESEELTPQDRSLFALLARQLRNDLLDGGKR